MRLMRFRCEGCGLAMALKDRPDRCFCCNSTDIIREGWRQRFKDRIRAKSTKDVKK